MARGACSLKLQVALLSTAFGSSVNPPLWKNPAKLWPCDASDVAQIWAPSLSTSTILLGSTGLLLNGRGHVDGGVVDAWTPTSPPNGDQLWRINGSHIVSGAAPLCVATFNRTGPTVAGTPLFEVHCRPGDANSEFNFDAATGLFRFGGDASLCLAVTGAGNCSVPPFSTYPYCQPSVPIASRVADLVSRLTLAEAIALLGTANFGVPRLGVPSAQYGEALHGVVSQCGQPFGSGQSGCATSFPPGVTMGASLNRTSWRLAGATVGAETRGLHNQVPSRTGEFFFAPDANLCRDPRWGRCQEVPGEDPTVVSAYAVEWVSGFQDDAGTGYARAISMMKHWSVYDQEGNKGVHDRSKFCATIDPPLLTGYMWPPFKAAAQIGVGGLMCSANGINGFPSCGHSDYNNGVLRGTWGWDGAIVTDGNGVGNLYINYGPDPLGYGCVSDGAADPVEACRVGLHGGVDVELGITLTDFTAAAIANGNVSQADVLTAVSRTLTMGFKMGFLDPPSLVPWTSFGAADVDTPLARQIALEAAQQALTLLQNNATAASPWGPGTALLPLRTGKAHSGGGGAVKTIALIGPNANITDDMLSNYHGANTVVDSQSPLLAITRRAAVDDVAVTFAEGCAVINCTSGAGIPAAVAVARAADFAILFLGLQPWHGSPGGQAAGKSEGEESDRSDIALPGLQLALLAAVVATGVPTVVVLIHGGCVGLDGVVPLTPSILDAYYPGEMGGDAIASVLFGDVNPSGRSPFTVYPTSFTQTREIIDYNFTSGEGVTHLYYTGVPVFAFGTGGSYTSFSYALVPGREITVVDARAWADGAVPSPSFTLTISNVGDRPGSHSVLGFLLGGGRVGQPLRELFDFGRVPDLAPGESATVTLTVPLDVAAIVTTDGDLVLEPGEYAVRLGDTIESGRFREASFRISGERITTFLFPR